MVGRERRRNRGKKDGGKAKLRKSRNKGMTEQRKEGTERKGSIMQPD